jgi:hypothetical protein
VQIEPGLRSKSPENGNILGVRRRLSIISRQDCLDLKSLDEVRI